MVWAKEFIPSKWYFGSILLASELKVAKLDVETSQKTSSNTEERNDTKKMRIIKKRFVNG